MKRFYATLFGLLAIPGMIFGEGVYQPTAANLKAREWFQDSKFGLFIHWGPYSVLEAGEWILETSNLSLEEYEKSAVSKFNPTNFDPAVWVETAKAAGMKYITVTSRHHDGFAMWATKQNDWNVVNGSPCGIDLLKSLADECRRQGMKLCFYYSQLDWHHLDYFPLGKSGHGSGRAEGGDFNKYLDYMDAQLTELLTEYGDVAGIWFDGMWDKPDAEWRLEKTYALIHRLQPAALIGSNHHLVPFPGEDLQMFENDLPGQSTQNFDKTTTISKLPLEMCETINDSWGYNAEDKKFKSPEKLILDLVKAAGNNANLLLNVGPRPDGTIQSEFVERLQAMGAWLKQNGETIYGTRGGPIAPAAWGVATQKGNKVYLHVLEWNKEPLALTGLGNVLSATLWSNKSSIPFEQDKDQLLLNLSEISVDEIDTIIELELADINLK